MLFRFHRVATKVEKCFSDFFGGKGKELFPIAKPSPFFREIKAEALPFLNCHSGLDPESHSPLSTIKRMHPGLSMRSRVGARDDKGEGCSAYDTGRGMTETLKG